MDDVEDNSIFPTETQNIPSEGLSVALTPENFSNRELSQIEFNKRLLQLAEDPATPLLERVKFLAIVGSNMDEFFMVRVASYVQKRNIGIMSARPDGYTPMQLLNEIRDRSSSLLNNQRQIMGEILRELEEEGVFIQSVDSLTASEREAVRSYFYDEVFPVLTPLAADHARPFPFISNLSLNLGVYLLRKEDGNSNLEFVRIKVPEALDRLVDLNQIVRKYGDSDNSEQFTYLWVEDVIADNLDLLFPGMTVEEQYPFRVTRNADIDYEAENEEDLHDISAIIEEGVRDRRFGQVVRLSVPENISHGMLHRLMFELKVEDESQVYMINGALGSANLFELVATDRPDLKYAPYVPKVAEMLRTETNIFDMIRKRDRLVHHPYDAFTPVEELFRQAASDPQVIAIKATLYRVGNNSPIVRHLLEARENDKQVAVLFELKARFDEENNLEWARKLEVKGVHVTYGVEQLPVKTHAKISLVIRKEGNSLRRYVHLGTGNYNASTARLYTDIGLFTANNEIGEDASRLFNRLTGYAPDTHYKRLLVAPEFLQPTFVELIENEIKVAQSGRPARVVFKMNQLEDDIITQKLYEASQAGVKVDMIIRGLCVLRPGIKDISENIRVVSILGRYLEHPRIYYFQNAPQDQTLYAGSADLMRRNLYNRVETIFPILDEGLRAKVLRILATDLRNNTATWELQSDGTYIKRKAAEGEPLIDSQSIFMEDSAGLDIDLG